MLKSYEYLAEFRVPKRCSRTWRLRVQEMLDGSWLTCRYLLLLPGLFFQEYYPVIYGLTYMSTGIRFHDTQNIFQKVA